MADKAIPDISLGGAEQNMSREELAAVTKAVATLSPEDRDLLAAVQESPFRLTTAEQFLEFEKNVDCFVLEPHVQTLEDLGWEYLEEKLTIDLTDDLRAAIDQPVEFMTAFIAPPGALVFEVHGEMLSQIELEFGIGQ